MVVLLMKAVKISWQDAESTSEWTHVDDLKEPGLTHTLGYLVKETETMYFVASSVAMHGEALHVGDTIAIPKAWITEVLEITDGPKKKTRRRT